MSLLLQQLFVRKNWSACSRECGQPKQNSGKKARKRTYRKERNLLLAFFRPSLRREALLLLLRLLSRSIHAEMARVGLVEKGEEAEAGEKMDNTLRVEGLAVQLVW